MRGQVPSVRQPEDSDFVFELKLLKAECAFCKGERQSRRLVLDRNDARISEERYLAAPAIFPNNDVKYEVNKLRAGKFAERTMQPITWVRTG